MSENTPKVAFGYAAVHKGKIEVKSVSPDEIGAKINFLTVHLRVIIEAWMTLDMIEELWKQCQRATGVEVIKVWMGPVNENEVKQ